MKKLIDFIALDIETTGFDFEKNEIIEIGAMSFVKGEMKEKFSYFIKPKKKIPTFIKHLTGITDEDLRSGIALKDGLEKLQIFVGKKNIVCHNAGFDIGFINEKLKQQNLPTLKNPLLDTLTLSRIYLPFILNHKLGTVAEYLQIELKKAHRAIHDAIATGHILLQLLSFIEKNIPLQINHQIYEVSRLDRKNSWLPDLMQKIIDFQKNSALLKKVTGKDINFHNRNYLENKPYKTEDPLLTDIFGKDGLISKKLVKFEFRNCQLQMAEAVKKVYEDREFLVVEAGTGVGKSLAYLIPSLIFSNKNAKKIIISTNTKNLQEQLFYKDLPAVKTSLNIPFAATLLKGRRNYICQRKWLETRLDLERNLSSAEIPAYLNLIVWKEFTKTGDISENSSFNVKRDGRVWKKVVADRFLCQGKKCPHFNDCFLMQIRRKAEKSNLVIINHHLLLADMQSDNAALRNYEYVVIDEAHNIPHLAPTELGISFSYPDFSNFFSQLFVVRKKFQTGILVGLKAAAKKSEFPEKEKLLLRIEKAISLLEDKNDIFVDLFKKVGNLVDEKGSYGKLRINDLSDHPFLSKYLEKITKFWYDLSSKIERIKDVMNKVNEQLFVDYDKYKEFLTNISQRIIETNNNLEAIFNPDMKEHAFWLENFRSNDPKYPNGVIVYCPLNIDDILQHKLYNKLGSAVFTSATMAIRGKFKYFSNRMGLNNLEAGKVHELIVSSPFDYQKQTKVLVAGFLPDPKDRFFSAQSIKIIKEAIKVSQAGTMVLFTSYKDLNETYDVLSGYFTQNDILLLTQGKGISRSAMLQEFRKHRNSVLLGTNSFWEGVDVPGESLELLVLFKLPFLVPSEPIVEAYLEKLEAEGKNSFMHYMLPNALLKYRQGFGRLIRHKTDRGVVLVLDNRIMTKKYGRYFMDTIPTKTIIPQSSIEIEDHLSHWFKDAKWRN